MGRWRDLRAVEPMNLVTKYWLQFYLKQAAADITGQLQVRSMVYVYIYGYTSVSVSVSDVWIWIYGYGYGYGYGCGYGYGYGYRCIP